MVNNNNMPTKYIFVTGGVISGLGKGVTSASIGAILQMLGETNITIKKLDPYLNVDAGTMNPVEHGEVFITNDGTETDLDLGYYERFLGIETTCNNSTSSGKLYKKLIEKERNGDYLGKTVQTVPHFTNIIKEFITYNIGNIDYIICEIGGSIGDIEAMAFYEALRQLKNDVGQNNILFIHLTYLLYLPSTKEIKTKPTQNTIKDLQQAGISPDILICRSEIPIPKYIKEKLSLHTNLPVPNIISALNAESIYQVPLNYIGEGLDHILINKLKTKNKLNTLKWKKLNQNILSLNNKNSITIGIIGKYTRLNDSYKSLLEALFHASIYYGSKIKIELINSRIKDSISFDSLDGIIIPGGFGIDGIENILSIIKLARENKIPTLGICLGMQIMVIEFCRNILKLENADSEEFNGHGPNVIIKSDSNKQIGGTMRLGKYGIKIKSSQCSEIYGSKIIYERHRHRYKIDNKYLQQLQANGLYNVGTAITDDIVEIIELNKQIHPWYIGTQYHPEYQSSPFKPHPLLLSFIKKCIFD